MYQNITELLIVMRVCLVMLSYDLDSTSKDEPKKEQSFFGIAGLILSLVSHTNIFVRFISFIFCVVSLCQKNKKRAFGIIGLIFSIILGVGGFIFSFSEYVSEHADEIYVEAESESTEVVVPLPTETEEEYKASCQEYAYKDVLRNPENYVGQRIKITVEIESVHEASWMNDTKYYFARSDNDANGYYYDDRYGIFDLRYSKDFKILEDDVITVYGEISDPEYTTLLIVSGSEIFYIDMKYMDFISE